MNSSRLILIAHAATEAQRRSAFPLDEPIAEREIVKLSAARWSLPQADRLWTAPEQRAQQTSSMLRLQSVVVQPLRDCDYGRWRGRSMDEIHAEEPAGMVSWLTDPGVAPHGGESIESLIERVGTWMSEQCNAKCAMAVTHATVIRAALVYALRMPAQMFWRFDIAPLSMTDLRFSRSVWTLRCSGCALQAWRHFEEEEAAG